MVIYYHMYNLELVTLLEKVLMKSYQMKNGEHAFHCPFCNHSSPDRTFGFVGSNIERTQSEIKEMIKDDAKKIAKKIKQGDQNAISEIYGEVK